MPISLTLYPLTTEAFKENEKRVRFQTSHWKHSLQSKPHELDPSKYGWFRNEHSKTLSPVMIPEHIPLVPEDILK